MSMENQAEAISDAIQDAHATQPADLATKRDLKDLEYRMTIRMGLMLVTVAGMLFTALRYFPPSFPAYYYQPSTQEMRQPVPALPVPPSPPAHG
ncbi:MAG: hypothetical protein H7837_08555 [Magnetococcus sp. MYC-9]